MQRRVILYLFLLLLLGVLATGIAYAKMADAIPRWLTGGGGGRATGGSVSMSGAIGQPIARAASSGSITICSGFWCGGSRTIFVFLPAVPKQKDPYAPPCSAANNYCEPNNSKEAAYGPLGPGREYRAYPDDANDYYYIERTTTGSIDSLVTGYIADGQVILYNASMQDIGSDFNYTGGDGTMQVTLSGLPAGKYYIRVYTGSGANTTHLYTLKVNY